MSLDEVEKAEIASHLAQDEELQVSKEPQDSDAYDPQGWSTSVKLQTYLTICCFTFLANVNASNLTVATVPLVKEFGVSLGVAGHAVCYNVLLFGLGNILWVPLSRWLGLRPTYLSALALLVAMNCWSGKATSFNSLLASRIMSGLAASAADATVPAVVAALFPLAERSRYLMMFHLCLSSGLFLGPAISGLFIQYQSWRWSCYFISVAGGVVFLVGLFTIREVTPHKLPSKMSAWKRAICFFAPVYADRPPAYCMVEALITIFSLAAYPNILWASFTIGVCVGWNIVVMLTTGSTMARPPYAWEVDKIGALTISGFLGTLAAYLAAGQVVDYLSARLNRRDGSYRPENRLPALILPAIIGPMGLIVFAESIYHKRTWVGVAFGIGMEAFGFSAISNIVVVYAVDHYKLFAREALVIVFIIRNTISVICSLYATDWLAAAGIVESFGEMAGIEYFFLLLAIPFYLYGNAVRKFVSSYGKAKGSTFEA